MKFLIIRHAIAEEKESFEKSGRDDSLRPLTGRGKKKMKKSIDGLKEILKKIDLILTSPFTRAEQTADLLRKGYPGSKKVIVSELRPSVSPASLLRWLRDRRLPDSVAIVGHEPQLSRFASKLLTGKEASILLLEKGGICCVEFSDKIDFNKGSLLWLLQPRISRRISGKRACDSR